MNGAAPHQIGQGQTRYSLAHLCVRHIAAPQVCRRASELSLRSCPRRALRFARQRLGLTNKTSHHLDRHATIQGIAHHVRFSYIGRTLIGIAVGGQAGTARTSRCASPFLVALLLRCAAHVVTLERGDRAERKLKMRAALLFCIVYRNANKIGLDALHCVDLHRAPSYRDASPLTHRRAS